SLSPQQVAILELYLLAPVYGVPESQLTAAVVQQAVEKGAGQVLSDLAAANFAAEELAAAQATGVIALGTVITAEIGTLLWLGPQGISAWLSKKFFGHLPPCSPVLPSVLTPFCSDARLPNGKLLREVEVTIVGTSADPNFLAGPAGFGAAAFVAQDESL